MKPYDIICAHPLQCSYAPVRQYATAAARQERFDRDAIALAQVPARRGVDADLVDHADRLVAGDQRVAEIDDAVEFAAVLLDVGAADAARLDAQDCVVAPDRGSGELDELDRARPRLDCGDHLFGHPRKLHVVGLIVK